MKVILAVDDSPYAKDVIAAVGKRPWPEDTQFKILTVVEPLSEEDIGPEFGDLLASVRQKRKHSAEKLCDELRARLVADVQGAIVHEDVREGIPRSEIIDAAVEWSADRILLGAHSRGICPHNLLGSVSRSVASHAPCSVEIVRAKQHHKRPVVV